MSSPPLSSEAGPPGEQAPPPGPGEEHGRTRHNRRLKILRWVLEIVVLGAAALFVLRQVGNAGRLGDIFRELRWHWVALGVGAELCSIGALSWLQQRLLRIGDLPVRVRDLYPVTMASNAVAQSLPAGTLFAEGYSFRQYQRLGSSRVLGVWAELSAGALASAALAAVAVAGAGAVGDNLRLKLLPVLAFVLAGALVAAYLFRRAPLLSKLIGRALRWAERYLPDRWCGSLKTAQEATLQMRDFQPSVTLWTVLLLAAMFNWGLDAVVMTSGLLAVGGPIPWADLLICYSAAQLLTQLPISPGGLGLVEGGLVELLSQFNVPRLQATAGVLVYRAISYWFLLLIGWLAVAWLAMHNRKVSSRNPALAGAACGPGS